jgi:undecaprenyl-diphosphatase
MGWLIEFDTYLFHLIHGMARKSQAIDLFMLFFSSYMIYILIFGLLTITVVKKFRLTGFSTILAIISGLILNFLITLVFDRERPFVSLEEVHVLIEKGVSSSFPSDQAVIAFAIAFAAFTYSLKWGTILLASAVFVGFSRIYVGHHFPFDIVGGIVIAFVAVYMINKLVVPFFLTKNEQKSAAL